MVCGQWYVRRRAAKLKMMTDLMYASAAHSGREREKEREEINVEDQMQGQEQNRATGKVSPKKKVCKRKKERGKTHQGPGTKWISRSAKRSGVHLYTVVVQYLSRYLGSN